MSDNYYYYYYLISLSAICYTVFSHRVAEERKYAQLQWIFHCDPDVCLALIKKNTALRVSESKPDFLLAVQLRNI